MRGSKRQRKKLAHGARRQRRVIPFHSCREAEEWFGRGSVGAALARALRQGTRMVHIETPAEHEASKNATECPVTGPLDAGDAVRWFAGDIP